MNSFIQYCGSFVKHSQTHKKLIARYFILDVNNCKLIYSRKRDQMLKLANNQKYQDFLEQIDQNKTFKQLIVEGCKVFPMRNLQNKACFDIYIQERPFGSIEIFAYETKNLEFLWNCFKKFEGTFQKFLNQSKPLIASLKESDQQIQQGKKAASSSILVKIHKEIDSYINIPYKQTGYTFEEEKIEKKRETSIPFQWSGSAEAQQQGASEDIIVYSKSSGETCEKWTIQLPNGNMFYGELNKAGQPHGNSCKEFCEDGNTFYGCFRAGKWHGVGIIVTPQLDMEEGEFMNGVVCGI